MNRSLPSKAGRDGRAVKIEGAACAKSRKDKPSEYDERNTVNWPNHDTKIQGVMGEEAEGH